MKKNISFTLVSAVILAGVVLALLSPSDPARPEAARAVSQAHGG